MKSPKINKISTMKPKQYRFIDAAISPELKKLIKIGTSFRRYFFRTNKIYL